MNKKKIVILGVAIVAILVIGVAANRGGENLVGGTTQYQKVSFVEGLYAGTNRGVNIDRSGLNLTVSTSNTATSTVAFGCWETTATSTETVMRVEAVASTTAPTNGSGVILVASYGACSN